MTHFSIVGICQIYNEIERGNLERFISHLKPLVDALIVYDDGSTDGGYEYLLKETPYVIRGTKNDFVDEISHKQHLLDEALTLSPDFILWVDADEVLTANASDRLQEICSHCVVNNYDAIALHEINLWRSRSWRRLDNLYDAGWFVRLWRVTPDISYGDIKKGLHQQLYPITIKNIERDESVGIIHYGFSSERNLAYKYLIYRSHGQRGYYLDRFLEESELHLEKVPKELFPDDLWVDDEKPEPITFEEGIKYVEGYKEVVFRPKFSIISLIYKSTEWAEFVYNQLLKYTDMKDIEFFFIANDPTEEVEKYLKERYIPHYIWNNTPEQKKEWYINNVYRAFNFGVEKAKGDFVVFINSDMAFSPGWFEHLWKNYNGSNCIASRLVESGKFKSGAYGIELDFGMDYSSYKEENFQQCANKIMEPKLVDGGLYMPLLIRKEHFKSVNGYPEGNIKVDSDLYNPVIAKEEDALLSGDKVLIKKLDNIGVKHQTAFDSIVYHFQCGERDRPDTDIRSSSAIIAVCNDLVTGVMGERVFWTYMVDYLPSAVGVDSRNTGNLKRYSKDAAGFINKTHPDIKMIIQNATFIDLIDPSKYTIVFLQDNLREMENSSREQEYNLKNAQKRVTNSITTALSYPEYDFDIIPIGVDSELFIPMDKIKLREEFRFKNKITGIFVGSLSETKGWPEVKKCITDHPEIEWIVVSKYDEEYEAPNVHAYNRISQDLLAKLLNCSDFFILGSKVETQGLAALEASLCDIPVLMHDVGIFREFSKIEKESLGVFTDDLSSGIDEITKKEFSPRQIILDKGLTVSNTIDKWKIVITDAFEEMRIEELTRNESTIKENSTFEKIRFYLHYHYRFTIQKRVMDTRVYRFSDRAYSYVINIWRLGKKKIRGLSSGK